MEHNESRALALSWWRGMTVEQKIKKAKELAPDKPFEFINTSTSWILRIWTKEHENTSDS